MTLLELAPETLQPPNQGPGLYVPPVDEVDRFLEELEREAVQALIYEQGFPANAQAAAALAIALSQGRLKEMGDISAETERKLIAASLLAGRSIAETIG